MTGNSSARKGKAVEQLVAATCVLTSGAQLNVLTAMVDDEGVDLTFKRRDGQSTIDVQVKSRFSSAKIYRDNKTLRCDVKSSTFAVRPDLFMLFVGVSAETAAIEHVFWVPSDDFAELALRVSEKLRINASLREVSDDRWRPYKLRVEELAPAVLEALG